MGQSRSPRSTARVRAALRRTWHLLRGRRADQCCFPAVGAVGPGPWGQESGLAEVPAHVGRSRSEGGVPSRCQVPSQVDREHAVHALYSRLAGGFRWFSLCVSWFVFDHSPPPPTPRPRPPPPRPSEFFTRGKQSLPQGRLRAHTALRLRQTQGCTEEVCGETGPGRGLGRGLP